MLRNITLSLDETLIKKARKKADSENKSLNVLFREWVGRYLRQSQAPDDYQKLMKSLRHIKPGKKFDRNDYNER